MLRREWRFLQRAISERLELNGKFFSLYFFIFIFLPASDVYFRLSSMRYGMTREIAWAEKDNRKLFLFYRTLSTDTQLMAGHAMQMFLFPPALLIFYFFFSESFFHLCMLSFVFAVPGL